MMREYPAEGSHTVHWRTDGGCIVQKAHSVVITRRGSCSVGTTVVGVGASWQRSLDDFMVSRSSVSVAAKLK